MNSPTPCENISTASEDTGPEDPWYCFALVHQSICVEARVHPSEPIRLFNDALVEQFFRVNDLRKRRRPQPTRRWKQYWLAQDNPRVKPQAKLLMLDKLTRAHILDDFSKILRDLHFSGNPMARSDYDEMRPVIVRAVRNNRKCVFSGTTRIDRAGRVMEPVAYQAVALLLWCYRKRAWDEAQEDIRLGRRNRA